MTSASTRAPFWNEFVTRYWERAPLVLARETAGLELDEPTTFILTVDALTHGDTRCRFFAGGREVFADLDDYWPRTDDRDWNGFESRMEQQLNGDEYLLIANHVQVLNASLFGRAKGFLENLYRAGATLPSDFADVDIIAGRYSSTPHGIHQDPGCNFMSGVKGRKLMLTWPATYDGIRPFTRRYEDLRQDAEVLEIGVDSLVYWPSSAWHVGESPAGLSVSASLALYFGSDPVSDTLEVVKALVDVEAVPGYSWEADLPAEIDDALSTVNQVSLATGDGRRLVVETWLAHFTGAGLSPVPELAALTGDPTPEFAKAARYSTPIVTRRAGPNEWVVACNGHCITVGTDFTEFLGRINVGERIRTDKPDTEGLLAWLFAARGLIPD